MKKELREHFNLVKELVSFIKHKKSYWLAPLAFVLLIVGVTFFILEGSVVAPFIYAIF